MFLKEKDRYGNRALNGIGISAIVALVLFVVVTLIGGGMWGCPQYLVWERELSGKAKLREAEWSRQVAVEEAEAKMESAKHLANAEVIRAEGVAEANQIIGESLGGTNGEAYLRYLWIQGLHDGTSETIYIPTEAQLPILEATRLK
jgi:hypothetical protein